MKSFSRFLWFILDAGILYSAGTPVQLGAQEKNSAAIMGTVQDQAGGAVQNATVVVRSESSGAESRTVTDAVGKFSITNLPVGNYTVAVSAPGFALASRQGVKATTERAEGLTI